MHMNISDVAQGLYEEKPSDTLYHYTSLSGLIGIVEESRLRATDIRFFNDAAEMTHTANLLRHAIALRQETSGANLRLLSQLQEWLADRLTNGHMLYVACFTTNGNLLSQWRSYCPPEKGVSVGFSPTKLLPWAAQRSFQVGRCVYDPQKQREIAGNILHAIEELAEIRGEITDHSRRHPLNSFHDVFEEVEGDLIRIAALLKHPSFLEEQEWRFVSPVVTNYVDAPIEYREGASMLIPFVEFLLPSAPGRRIDIDRVVLGPTPNANGSMTSLSRYLSKKGSSPTTGVFYCQIPYRTI